MPRRYITADVFTDRLFSGNPVAVVLDAQGLSAAQMQAITVEFGYSETTFVLPPRDPANTAWVRIFTPDREIPFAGHPNIGTAYVLAAELSARGAPLPDHFTFEEGAGLVAITLWHEAGQVIGAELMAPEPLSRRTQVTPAQAAACLSLDESDILTSHHTPQVVSVGLPFLVVQLATRQALRQAKPDRAAYQSLLPLDGAHSVYAYTVDTVNNGEPGSPDIQARMFTGRMTEDPATGSATSAMAALFAHVRGAHSLDLNVAQGVDMGRPSALAARAREIDGSMRALVGGCCIRVMDGTLHLDEADAAQG